MIELRTLGSLQLRDVRGRDLCGKLQPKRTALFVYLAHPPRRFHRRDTLLALFWPELGPKRARNSLRQSLYSLRETLGRGALVARGYEEIGVADSVWSDVAALETALAEQELERAIELYGGELLEGFHVQNVSAEFEHWLEIERFRLRNRVVHAALRLTEHEEAEGNVRPAASWARTALRLDPDNEGIVQKVIELLDQAGDRAGAIRLYEDFARRTQEEYDLQPDDETRRLIEAVQGRGEPEAPVGSAPETEILEPPTSFVGRERELASLKDLLDQPRVRLVTLTGLGGLGKTRLAAELARRMEESFENGVRVVGLSKSEDPRDVIPAIARGCEVQPKGSRGVWDSLTDELARSEILLVLDGMDRVCAAGPDLLRLLRAAPRLKILVTSRVPLKVSGEREFPVPALSLPQPVRGPSLDFPLNSEAVALLVERAQEAQPDFHLTATNMDIVAEICCRLDGLPLALELAAARLKTFTLESIARRLEKPFSVLTGGPADRPPRHRTLEATLDWSYELLNESEKSVFRRLGAFGGSFGLDVAEPLFETGGVDGFALIDNLATLVDHSLVRQTETFGESRFEMLDTVHAFAAKRLAESGEEGEWRRRVAERLVEWVEEGEALYCTSEQGVWFRRLSQDEASLRSAFLWALQKNKTPLAVRMGAALWPFWWSAGYLSEGLKWLEDSLMAKGRVPRVARAKALLGASWLASSLGDHTSASKHASHSARVYQAAGDASGYLRALEARGFIHLEAGEIGDAETAFETALKESGSSGNRRREAISLGALGQIASRRGDDRTATSFFRKSIALARREGESVEVAQGLLFLGDIALRAGDPGGALDLYEESLDIHQASGQKMNVAWTLSSIGRAQLKRGDVGVARRPLEEALTIFHDLGYLRGMGRSLAGLAEILFKNGDFERAVQLLGGAAGMLERTDDELAPEERADLETLIGSLRGQLRASRFTACWERGQRFEPAELMTLVAREALAERGAALG